MQLKKVAVLIISISLLASLCAQGTWKVYTKDDGLTSNKIYHIFKDSKGNLWFNFTFMSQGKTEHLLSKGMMKYDGQNWTKYYNKKGKNPLQTVSIVFEDSKGTIWLGNEATLVMYNNGLMRINGSSYEKIKTKVGAKFIVEDSGGKLWFGGRKFGSYDGKSVTEYSKKEFGAKNITALHCDKSDNIWVGTKKGVSFFDGDNWNIISNVLYCPAKTVYSIISDTYGNIWIGAEDGVFKYDGTNWQNVNGLMGDATKLIVIDSHNNIYAIAGKPMKKTGLGVVDLKRAISSDLANKGLSIFENGGWRAFSDGEGVPDNLKPTFFEDNSGNLWFNTYDDTIYKFDAVSWTSFDENNGFKASGFSTMLEDSKGNYWFGLDNGLGKFDGQNWSYFTKDNVLPSNSINSIMEDDGGNIWFGTKKGIVKYTP